MGTSAYLKAIGASAWEPSSVALGLKKTLARRGRYLAMLGGTPDEAEKSITWV